MYVEGVKGVKYFYTLYTEQSCILHTITKTACHNNLDPKMCSSVFGESGPVELLGHVFDIVDSYKQRH